MKATKINQGCCALLGGTALLAVLASPALAQDTAAPATAGPATAQSQTPLDAGDIIVTAQRRSESLSKVPVAVSAFDGETLQKRVVVREQDLAALVPGLTVKSGQNQNQISFTMRGQTLDPFSGTSPAVLTYLNEAPYSGGNTATAFFDFSSLQVLKGPQGTLFGRNATGGAVLYESTKPGDDFGGYVTIRGGERRMRQVQGAVDLPLVKDVLAIRVAGDYSKSRGYIKNLFTGNYLGNSESKSGRITIKFNPTETIENTLVAQYSDFGGSEANGYLYSYYRVGETNNGYALTSTLDFIYGPNSPFSAFVGNGPPGRGTFPGGVAGFLAFQQANKYKTFLSFDLPHKAHTAFISNTTTIEAGDNLTIKNIFSYTDAFARTPGILSGSPFGSLDLFNYTGLGNGPPGGETFDTKRWTNELQLQGDAMDNRLKYIIGGFISSSTQNDYIPVVVGSDLPAPLADIAYFYKNKNRSKAVFSQATYEFADGLSATLGGRYTWEKVSLSQNTGSLFTGSPGQSAKLHAPSWTASLQYQVNPNNLVYFAQRGSFRSGNFNGTVVPFNDLNFFKNEKTYDFEVGYKFSGRAGDSPAHFNIALYQQHVKNAQHAVYAVIAGNPAGFTVNVPKKRVRGVEVDGDIGLSGWLKVGFAGAYTDAKYTDNIVDLSTQTGTPGYVIPFDSYPDTPKWTGSLYAEVTLPTPEEWGDVLFRADSFSQTSTFFSSNEGSITPRTKLKGYTTVSARLSWNEIMRSNLSLAVYAKNLFNRFYYQSGYVEGASGGFNTAIPGEPQTFGAELTFKF